MNPLHTPARSFPQAASPLRPRATTCAPARADVPPDRGNPARISRLLLGVFLAALLIPTRPASAATTLNFSNSTPITITDNTTASPYPSAITLSNQATVTTKIQVLLSNFSHGFPTDVDILLVGPQGQRCMLMSDAGGGVPGYSNAILNFSSTFPTVLPQNTASTGNLRPANYANEFNASDLTDNFPAPGPGTLNDQPADLNVFNLTNPNGTWSLYVVDDTSGFAGSIAGGWTLQVTVPAIFTVTNTNDSGAGSLRAALAAAGDGDLINFSALFNTPQTINLLTVLSNITKSVTIQGPGANLLNVRRDYNAASFTIFNIASGVTNGVAISGMTISNGRDVGGAGQDGFGGGIDSTSNLTLTNVYVTGNQAVGGGGVALGFADGVFTGCTFSGNTATLNGGGINYEGDGGHTLRLINSTVSGNSATNSGGGGIINFSQVGNSRLEVVSSTVANNTGGGIRTFTQTDATATATTTLRNTVIAGNTPNNLATGTAGGGAATFQTLGFNLSDNYNGVFPPLASDKTTSTPRLGPLSLNGGQTPTHALLGGSPALNSGDPSGSTTDQRGVPRVFSTNADIGAVEMQTDTFNFTVLNTNDSGAGSLRQAITNANANGTALRDIVFANNLSATTINLQSALPDITSNLTINGRVTNPTTGQLDSIIVQRDPNAAASFRIFNIVGGLSRVAINTLTIANGNAGNGTFGGGVFSGSNLTLTNVHVTGNQAGSGGGVGLIAADGTFTGCTFSSDASTNSVGTGGGIFYQGDGGHTLRVVSSTVSGNRSANQGGGIENISGGGNSRLEVVNSTITGNTAQNGGGIGTFTQNGAGNTATTTLRNTIIAGDAPNNLTTGTSSGGAATVTSFGFSLADDNGGGFLIGTGDKINAFAGLGPLQNNGGPTPTHALLRNSAALDAGNSSGSGTIFDQRGPGFARTIDYTNVPNSSVGDGTDIGAVEGTVLTIATITRPTNGHAVLLGFGTPNLTCTVEASPDLSPGSFAAIGTSTPDGTGALQYDDAGAVGLTKRFYRLRLP